VLRVERGGGVLNPGRALGHDLGHRPGGLLLRKDAAPDEGPERLVVVGVGRVDDGDLGGVLVLEELGGHGQASGAAADDENLVLVAHGTRGSVVAGE